MTQNQHRNEASETISGPAIASSNVNFSNLMSEQPTSSTATASEDVQGYQQFCSDKWTKRGQIDTNMYNYCLKSEHDGYKKLVSLIQEFGGYS
ncbi:MAG: hypothetical protein ACRYG8_37105 [Janthinobacterium lividum]